MWMRWNDSTHIFEQSTNDGASWAVLPLNASVINEGSISVSRLPGNLAVKDANNNFTVGQTMPSLTVSTNATVGGTLGVTGLSTLASLGVTGNATIGGTLGVTGAVTTGGLTSGTHVVNGNLSITGLFNATGFGTHGINTSGVGILQFSLTNSATGAGTGTAINIGTDSSYNCGTLQAFSSGFSSASFNLASGFTIAGTGTGGMSIVTTPAVPIRFYTASLIRLTITQTGELFINTLGNLFTSKIAMIVDSTYTQGMTIMSMVTTNNIQYMLFLNSAAGGTGTIVQTGATTVSYATTSDKRLKTDLGRASNFDSLRKLIIHDFEWRNDKRRDRGMFAQEAKEFFPNAVIEGQDDLGDDGFPKMPWMTDYSKLVPDLVAGWQEHDREIAELKRLLNGKSSN